MARVPILLAAVLPAVLVATPAAASHRPPPPPPPPASAPPAPAQVAPTGGAAAVQPVTLRWGTSHGTAPVVAYNWQVASNSSFTALQLQGSTLEGAPDALRAAVSGLPNGRYFWRVDAVAQDPDPIVGLVVGPWSPGAAFTVTGSAPGTPAAPVLTGPPDLFQYHPFEFVRTAWNPVPGADHYLLEYDNEPTFTLPLFNADFTPIPGDETTAPVMFGEPVGNLWFRVRAVAADGTRGLPSNVRRVTITFNAPLPPAPLLTGPPSGTSSTLPLTLDWGDDANPQTYELQIGTDPTFAEANAAECTGVEWCVRVIPESRWAVPNLHTGVHYWRVRSEHGDRSPTEGAVSAWSAVRSFTVLQTPVAVKFLSVDSFAENGVRLGHVGLDPWLPAAGATVALSSSDPAVLSVPASVFVERPASLDGDAAIAPFVVTPGAVTAPTRVTITATLPTGAVTTQFTVTP